jgi:hypothetical protein
MRQLADVLNCKPTASRKFTQTDRRYRAGAIFILGRSRT